MARDHARIYLSVWQEDDFRTLDVTAQHTYWTLLAQPALSYCGVLDYFPGRVADLAAGNTEAKVKTAVKTLVKSRHAVLDPVTHELLIRSYVRHDGVLDRVNMGKAVARAYNRVVSRRIQNAILTELGRLHIERPNLAGWTGFRDLAPKAYDMALAMSSTIPFPMASGEA